MTSRQLVDFVEGKLKQHGIRKVVPAGEILAKTYKMFTESDRLFEKFDELKEAAGDEGEAPTQVPADLEAKVKAALKEKPDVTWHRAVRLLVDPDAPADDDEDNAGDDDADEDDVDE